MHRVGLIIPSSNVVVEDTLRRQAGDMNPAVAIHIARFSVVAVDLGGDSVDQFQDAAIDRAIDQLMEAEVDRIIFAGTAGAWLGIDRERAWCRRATDRADLPVTSTTLLALEALCKANAARIGLITPFRTDVHEAIVQNFAGEGFATKVSHCLELDRSRDMADVSPERIADLVRSCLDEGCDTVLCFCTNFRGLDACQQISTVNPSATLLDSVGLTLHAAGTNFRN